MKYSAIKKYWIDNYRCSNMVISIAGNLGEGFDHNDSFKELDDEIKLIFTDHCPNKKTPNQFDKKLPNQDKIRVSVEERQHAEQLHLCIGFPMNMDMNSPKRYVAHLLRIILAGNMSSRFFTLLREEYGIAYNVSADVYLCESGGSFSIHTGVRQEGLYKKEKSTKELADPVYVIIKALFDLKQRDPITQQELDTARQYLKGMIRLATEDSQFISEFYGKAWLLDMPVYTIDRDLHELDKVSLTDIHNLIEEVFVMNRLNVAAIGNVNEKKFTKYIKSYKKLRFK